MEYRAVLEALGQLQKRERYILLARILEERSFTELARELQVGYRKYHDSLKFSLLFEAFYDMLYRVNAVQTGVPYIMTL